MAKKTIKNKANKKKQEEQQETLEDILENEKKEQIEKEVIRKLAKKSEVIKNFRDIKVIHDKTPTIAITDVKNKELIINTGFPLFSDGEVLGVLDGVIIHEAGHLDQRITAPADSETIDRQLEQLCEKKIPPEQAKELLNIVYDMEIHYQYNQRKMVKPSQSGKLRDMITILRNKVYEKKPDDIVLSMEYPKTPLQIKVKEIIDNRAFTITKKCEEIFKAFEKDNGKKGEGKGKNKLHGFTQLIYGDKEQDKIDKKAKSIKRAIEKEVEKLNIEKQLSQLGFSAEEISQLCRKYDRDDLVDRVADLTQCFRDILPIFQKETTRKDVKKRLKSNGTRMCGYRELRDYNEMVDNPEELITSLLIDEISVPHNVDVGRSGTIAILRDVSGCFVGDTLIQMSNGEIKKIQDVKEGDYVVSTDFKRKIEKKCKRVFKFKANELVEVKTKTKEFLCTPNHKVFVFKNNRVIEKNANELDEGDLIFTVRNLNIQGKQINLPQLSYKKNRGGCPSIPEIPKTATIDFCMVVGYFLGDGNIDTHKKNCETLCITDKDKNNLETYKKVIERVFKPKNIRIVKYNRQRLVYNSSLLYRYFKKNIPELLKKSRKRTIPSFVHKLEKKELAGFMRGLFDAEGTVGDHNVEIASTSRTLLKQLQLLLLRFGIPSYIYDYIQNEKVIAGQKIKRTPYSRLYIYDRWAIHIFKEKIGFNSKDKTRRLNKMLEKLEKKWKNRKQFSQYTYAPKSEYGYYEHKDYVTAILTGSEEIVLERVKSVDVVNMRKAVTVYDLEVEGLHNYLAGGVFVHNSVSSPPMDKYVRDVTVSLIKLAKKERHLTILCDFHTVTEFIKDSRGKVKTDRYNELLLESMRFKCGHSTILSKAISETLNLIGSEKANIYIVSDSYVDKLPPKVVIPKNIRIHGIWVGDYDECEKNFTDVIHRGRGKLYKVHKEDSGNKKLITEIIKEF